MPKKAYKYHQINQSALYNIKTKRKLGDIFNLNGLQIEKLSCRPDNYLKFKINQNSPQERTVETPKPILRRIHTRIFKLLRKIEPPIYLHSGVKGRSYITNATAHLNSKRLLKVDIKKFYPSTKREHVYCFFRDIMLCSNDVSSILASLCTCDDHVPTGSPVSQLISHYSHKEMFDEIFYYSTDRNLTMTSYVDDITVSGESLNRGTLFDIKGIILKNGLKSHPEKEKVYLNNTPRVITGVIVNNNEIKLPNSKHLDIIERYKEVFNMNDSVDKRKFLKSVIGKTVAAIQLEPKSINMCISLVNELNRLNKILDN